LISYGLITFDNYRLAAGYVDRILKCEKPADLPVQAPTKFETVAQPSLRCSPDSAGKAGMAERVLWDTRRTWRPEVPHVRHRNPQVQQAKTIARSMRTLSLRVVTLKTFQLIPYKQLICAGIGFVFR